jgi:hypothetical protein
MLPSPVLPSIPAKRLDLSPVHFAEVADSYGFPLDFAAANRSAFWHAEVDERKRRG